MKRLMIGLIAIAVCVPTLAAQTRPSAAVSLKQDMRKLWTDHVVWTRDYVVAALADAPAASASAARLLRNQEEIGNAVAAYYGAPA